MFSLSILGRRWPSFWQIFSEATWHAGQRMLLSEKIAERTYYELTGVSGSRSETSIPACRRGTITASRA